MLCANLIFQAFIGFIFLLRSFVGMCIAFSQLRDGRGFLSKLPRTCSKPSITESRIARLTCFTHCSSGIFSCIFICWFFFKIIFFGGGGSFMNTNNQFGSRSLSGLILISIVCKSYQQTTLGGNELRPNVVHCVQTRGGDTYFISVRRDNHVNQMGL